MPRIWLKIVDMADHSQTRLTFLEFFKTAPELPFVTADFNKQHLSLSQYFFSFYCTKITGIQVYCLHVAE